MVCSYCWKSQKYRKIKCFIITGHFSFSLCLFFFPGPWWKLTRSVCQVCGDAASTPLRRHFVRLPSSLASLSRGILLIFFSCYFLKASSPLSSLFSSVMSINIEYSSSFCIYWKQKSRKSREQPEDQHREETQHTRLPTNTTDVSEQRKTFWVSSEVWRIRTFFF